MKVNKNAKVDVSRALEQVGLHVAWRESSDVEGLSKIELEIWSGVIDLGVLNKLAAELGSQNLLVKSGESGKLIIVIETQSRRLRTPEPPPRLSAIVTLAAVPTEENFMCQMLVSGRSMGRYGRSELAKELAAVKGAYCAYEIKGGPSQYTLAVCVREEKAAKL